MITHTAGGQPVGTISARAGGAEMSDAGPPPKSYEQPRRYEIPERFRPAPRATRGRPCAGPAADRASAPTEPVGRPMDPPQAAEPPAGGAAPGDPAHRAPGPPPPDPVPAARGGPGAPPGPGVLAGRPDLRLPGAPRRRDDRTPRSSCWRSPRRGGGRRRARCVPRAVRRRQQRRRPGATPRSTQQTADKVYTALNAHDAGGAAGR